METKKRLKGFWRSWGEMWADALRLLGGGWTFAPRTYTMPSPKIPRRNLLKYTKPSRQDSAQDLKNIAQNFRTVLRDVESVVSTLSPEDRRVRAKVVRGLLNKGHSREDLIRTFGESAVRQAEMSSVKRSGTQ